MTDSIHINLEQSVGSLVAANAVRARVLEWHGIDYCCGGRKSLGEACREKGLDPHRVAADIARSDRESSQTDATDWSQAQVAELIDNILSAHHGYLQMELPRLTQLVRKVASVHGPNHPYLREVADLFEGLRGDMETHLKAEEEDLFPALRLMASQGRFEMLAGDLLGAVQTAEQEHAAVGDALHRLNALTDGYKLPPDGCETFRAMLHGLLTLEADTHLHIHKENNILFPKAVELAA